MKRLIVSDGSKIAEEFIKTLSEDQAGGEIVVVSSQEEADERMRTEKFDSVISNIRSLSDSEWPLK